MKKILFLIFFLVNSNYSFAEENIVYVDINKIINESKVGKSLNDQLKIINDKNIEEFKNTETSLKAEEKDILKQKNILKEEEFNLKVNKLREKYESYNQKKQNKNADLRKLRDIAANKILTNVNEILRDYSIKNSISMIIDKKNIVIGKTDLDITNDILDLLNKKISNISLN
tara:strand:- start:161 stop:676 length:516 start_codon:yes stop_codon:yes gene_type:complete